MNINLLTIGLTILGSSIIFSRITRFIRKEKKQTLFKLMITLGIWLPVMLTALFPGIVIHIVSFLGLGKNFNTLIFIIFVGIFVFLFKLLSYIERLESNITEIVRKEALKDLEMQ